MCLPVDGLEGRGLDMHPDSDAIFQALADPNRRALLGVIGEDEELTVSELADRIDSIGRTAISCLLYTSPSPRDGLLSRMPSSA